MPLLTGVWAKPRRCIDIFISVHKCVLGDNTAWKETWRYKLYEEQGSYIQLRFSASNRCGHTKKGGRYTHMKVKQQSPLFVSKDT